MWNIIKFVSVFIFPFSFPVLAIAFDSDVKKFAKSKEMMEISNRVAQMMDISEYGACANLYTATLALWSAGNFPKKESQLVSEILGNGILIYRRNFITQFRTSKPLEDVVRQSCGNYLMVNAASITAMCTSLVTRADSSKSR